MIIARRLWLVTACCYLLGTSTVAFGEEHKARRLESVTWNPVKNELTWVVSSGEKPAQGEYRPDKQQTYVIDMDAATMMFNGETRRFSRQEAANVRSLMAAISTYAVESTVWWEQGHGQRVTGGERVSTSPPSPPSRIEGRCELPALTRLLTYQH